jgi:type VI protein secretion system component Hcp
VATDIYLTLYGVGGAGASHPERGRIALLSASWGFDRTPGGGTFEYHLPIIPSLITVTLTDPRVAPQIMTRFLNRSVITTGFIRAYQPNVQGVLTNVATVTLHSVRVVDFRQHGNDSDGLVDTVQLMFSGLDYDYPPGPTASFALPS